MPGGMIFKRHPPGQTDAWEFTPGNQLIELNDIRFDAETRELLLDMLSGGGGTTILVVGDVEGGDGVTVVDNGDGTITITVQVEDLPDILALINTALTDTLDPGTAITIAPNGPLLTVGVDLTSEELQEMVRDTISAALAEGTGINIVVDDGLNTISVALDEVDAEVIRDTIGTVVTAGTGLTKTVDDALNTVTLAIDTAAEAERARDTLATAIVAGSGITVTPNDGADTITIANSATAYTDEMARDALGTALVAGSGVAVTVNDGSDTITLDLVGRTINDQTGTSYTLVLADATKWVRLNNAGAIVLTVPPNSSVAFPVGTEIEGNQAGIGQVTITPGSGVTVNGVPGLKVAAQYGVYGLKKVATDTWVAYGRLSA